MSEYEEDEYTLPADTLQALHEFLRERAEQEILEEQAVKGLDDDFPFEENWQLSQFWYNEETRNTLGKVIQKIGLKAKDKIALLSCPSLYTTIKSLHKNVRIFEFDERFSSLGQDFVSYDFNNADDPDYLLEHTYQYKVVIADPPFLSEDCITKVASIIKRLLKPDGKIIFCSGQIVEPWLSTCLVLNKCDFRPEHKRNLGNEFASYANFNLDEYL